MLDVQDIKNSINLIEYASSFAPLNRESAREWAGACPKCGGNDRFHCRENCFFCRQCHPEFGDIIEFVQWKDGISFTEAISVLGGVDVGALVRVERETSVPSQRIEPQSRAWCNGASQLATDAQQSLHSVSGKDGREYLESRGLSPETWKAFSLGFKPDVSLPGTYNKKEKSYCYPQQPAITIPWIDEHEQIAAIRYRFTGKHTYTDINGKVRKGENKSSLYGSDFASRLCGYQALSSDKSDRTLVVVEGEINMMSIWQLTSKMGIDTLSIGSQGQKPVDATKIASQYRHTIIWADEPGVASSLTASIAGAYGVYSPKGMDANDLLKSGLLGGYLAAWRYQVCKSDEDIKILRKWLTSAVDSGIADKGTIRVLTGINEKHPQQTTNHPDWLKQLSCYGDYAARSSRVEKQGLLFALWEREGELSPDEVKLMDQLERELGAPITNQ